MNDCFDWTVISNDKCDVNFSFSPLKFGYLSYGFLADRYGDFYKGTRTLPGLSSNKRTSKAVSLYWFVCLNKRTRGQLDVIVRPCNISHIALSLCLSNNVIYSITRVVSTDWNDLMSHEYSETNRNISTKQSNTLHELVESCWNFLLRRSFKVSSVRICVTATYGCLVRRLFLPSVRYLGFIRFSFTETASLKPLPLCLIDRHEHLKWI